jgi:hypothetical protein
VVHLPAHRTDTLGFYFAVQSGGEFDIDFTVLDPDDRVLLEGNNEKQGDYIFTANKVSVGPIVGASSRATELTGGRLANTRSASKTKPRYRTSYWISSTCALASQSILPTDRNSIMVESEPRRTLSAQTAPLKEHTSTLEESTYKLNGLLQSITRSQK